MATNNQNQKSEEPEPFLMPSPKQEKDVITIMGVQGLSHNDFNIRLHINRETFIYNPQNEMLDNRKTKRI